jgi:uncharacterized surface protein with fasciclin (FAS1) repeats
MKKLILNVAAIIAISLLSNNLFAQSATAATPTGDALATISANTDYNVFGIAIRAANLGATLKGTGPITVFAPNNAAFSNLTSGKLDSLMQDPAKLATILKGHIVNGKYDKAAIIKTLGSGTPTLKTIDGQTLTLSVNAKKNLEITDSQGNKTDVIAFDMLATNGVIIGVNAILFK